MARPTMFETPLGIGQYMWINTPDTKYDPEGTFKDQLILDHAKPTTLNLMALIDEKVEAAFKAETEGLSAGELKKWSTYTPYVVEEDDDGNPTGRVIFTFKRNHIITIQGGEKRELSIAVYDSAGKALADDEMPRIFGGTEHKVLFSFRNVKVPGIKKAGVKLDFAAIKVFKLGGGKRGDPFAHADEDGEGWVHSEEQGTTNTGSDGESEF